MKIKSLGQKPSSFFMPKIIAGHSRGTSK
jgi:hypothetical protein